MKKNTLMIFMSIILFAATGNTTMLDFGDNIPLPKGFYSLLYLNNYSATDLKDKDGKKLTKLDLSWNVATLRPLYYTKLFDHTVALTLYVPFGTVTARNGLGEKERSTGLGDLIFNPGVFVYENAKSGTYVSVWENVNIPVGDWSEGRAIRGGPNLGLHYWFFEHQLTLGQLFLNGKASLDLNLNYYQRLKEPSLGLRAGDSVEVEGILGYGLTDKLKIGAYFDYWADICSTRMNGERIENSQRKYFGIGPSLSYGTEKWALHLRFVPEVWAINGPKGFQTWLRFYYAF